MHKLTEDNVRYIRASRGVVRGVDLAAQFGVSKGRISSIQSGDAWSHI